MKFESLSSITNDDSGFIDEAHRTQSPIGFSNEAQTIERIGEILNELERTHGIPRSKLSHDSSTIDADLASTAGDVILVPPVSVKLVPNITIVQYGIPSFRHFS
jgi:hypothetical protein